MTNLNETPACDVAVVGCGPTGAVLANLLGALGLDVVVLERDREVFPVPRATHIDEETVRNFMATGLLDELLPHMTPFGAIEVVDESGRTIWREIVEDRESPHGFAGSMFFDQPAFERVLRAGLGRYPNVSLRTGVAIESLETDGDGVKVAGIDDSSGEAFGVRAAWVVGCDGGRSAVRLSSGIAMQSIAERRPWMIADSLLRDAADSELLPQCFTYYFDRDGLVLYAHGIGVNRRWEFQLETEQHEPSREAILGRIARFIDPSKLEVTRLVKYEHSALVAAHWRLGRVLLAGDAAHLMPPMAGQGMCSGIRDAMNLAWKLEHVVRGRSPDALLDTYERERAPHVREVMDGTLFIGRRLDGDTAFKRWRRRSELRLVSAVPGLKNRIRESGIRRPPLREGFLDARSALAGVHIPMAEVVVDGRSVRLDDAMGYRFGLVARSGVIGADNAAWAEARGIGLWDAGGLDGWMTGNGVDFVLVRPDRIVFSAGPAADLARVRSEFGTLAETRSRTQ